MGQSVSSTVTCCSSRREGPDLLCGFNESVFGEDAFYRDAFHDCSEGNESHDHMFAIAAEQARLKYRKGNVLAMYASFQLQESADVASAEFRQCIADRPRQLENGPVRGPPSTILTPIGPADPWEGRTMVQWREDGVPPTGHGPYWSVGSGGLKVRGDGYVHTGLKIDAAEAMYEAVSCDALRAHDKITDIMGRLIKTLPSSPCSMGSGDMGGGVRRQWTSDCPLPRVLCINLMLPYETGLNPFRQDGGCSFVGLFHITPMTLKDLNCDNPPPHVKLFRDFCQGPCGTPGGPASDPARCLNARVDGRKKKDKQDGIFKAIAHCVNPEDVHVPELFHTYNGKPCLITKSGYIIKDPAGEWMEIGIDVRGFNVLARKMLTSFRGLLPKTKIHYGFLVQGAEDESLPEGLLCDMFVYGADMLADPLDITNRVAAT